MGRFITGPAVKNHISPKKGKTINCNISNYVPFVVLVCQRVPPRHLSSPTSSNIFIAGFCDWHGKSSNRKKWENECRVTGEPVSWISSNKNKNEGREGVQSDLLHDLPDWLQDFREDLVDESSPSEARRNPAPKDQDTSSSSHELPMSREQKVEAGLGKHSIYSHFPKDPIVISAWRRK